MKYVSVPGALRLTTAESMVPIPDFHEVAARDRLSLCATLTGAPAQKDFAGDLKTMHPESAALRRIGEQEENFPKSGC